MENISVNYTKENQKYCKSFFSAQLSLETFVTICSNTARRKSPTFRVNWFMLISSFFFFFCKLYFVSCENCFETLIPIMFSNAEIR